MEGKNWSAGSLKEISPLVMQLEAQLHVVRWEWEGGSWSVGCLREYPFGCAAVGATARRRLGLEGVGVGALRV